MLKVKKGSVVFMLLIVMMAIASITYMYINFSDSVSKNARYIAGRLMKDTWNAYSDALATHEYFDAAADLSAKKAALELDVNLLGCTTPSGFLLVNQSCSILPIVRDSYYKLFDAYFFRYYKNYPKTVTMGKNLEHYFLKNKFYTLSYEPLILKGNGYEIRLLPSFEVASPINLSEIEKNYEIAKVIDYDCRQKGNYKECVQERTEELHWHAVNNKPLNSFVEDWLNCANQKEACICSIPLKDGVYKIERLGYGFNFSYNNTSIVYYGDLDLCNVHFNGLFDRRAVVIENNGKDKKIKLSNPPGAWKVDYKWKTIPVSKLKILHFNGRSCVLTADMNKALKMLERSGFNPDARDCQPSKSILTEVTLNTSFEYLGRKIKPDFAFLFKE